MLYYKATTGCGLGVFCGVSVRKHTAPVALILALPRSAGAQYARVASGPGHAPTARPRQTPRRPRAPLHR